jgi:hypothetical protein
MEEDEIIAQGVILAQGQALASHMLVTELIAQWLATQPDPQRNIRMMADAISRRLERPEDLERGCEPLAVSHARKLVDDFFSTVDRVLVKRLAGQGGPPPQS